MPRFFHRLLSTLCVGLLATTPAFAKTKKPVTKPAPPQTAEAEKKLEKPAPPANEAPSAPEPSGANAPSGGGGW